MDKTPGKREGTTATSASLHAGDAVLPRTGSCHLMREVGPKKVISREEKRCFWKGIFDVRVFVYVRFFSPYFL